MKYHEILSLLTDGPLLITPSSAGSLLKLFEEHRAMSAEEWAKREGTGQCGEKIELEQAENLDGIMAIPINGPIGRGLSSFEKGAGAVDVNDVLQEIDQAEGDEEIRAILLHMDTPGGMVNGTPELADRVQQAGKPVYVYSPGMIASAGYWIAAAADKIYTTRSADIGSIGVYAPFYDVSQMAAQKGIKVQVFTSGKYKGMGVPGTSLTKVQQEFMQERVNQIAQEFYEHVRANKPDVPDEAMQGQTFRAEDAKRKGMIDGIVADMGEVLEMLQNRIAESYEV